MTAKSASKPSKLALAGVEADLKAVEAAVGVVGGKWKIMILAHLFGAPRRFSELQRLMPLISQQSLVRQLRELERDGIIKRHIYPKIPPHVEYSLTETGLKIGPLMKPLMAWGYEILRVRTSV